MAEAFFNEVPDRIPFGGLGSTDPLAYKVYDPDRWSSASAWRTTSGSRSASGIPSPGRASTCSAWGRSIGRGWIRGSTPMAAARTRLDAAFEFLDQARRRRSSASTTATSRPRARPSPRLRANLDAMVDDAAEYTWRGPASACCGDRQPVQPPALRGRRATNPDPEVFAYAAAQVKPMLEATHRLGGANYVLWGGREGYETLLNTDLRRERSAARPVPELVAEHKHRDRLHRHAAHRAQAAGADQAPVRLRRRVHLRLPRPHGLEGDTASTSRPTTPRWPATASTTRSPTRSPTAIFGSIDANRGDPQNGWDTDQFPNSVDELSLALYEILRAGGSPRAASTSTPSCAARASTGPTCSTATSAASTRSPESLLVAPR